MAQAIRSDIGSQVIVNGEVRGNMPAKEYFRHKRALIPDILQAYNSLAEEFDIDDMTEMPLLSVTRSRTSIVCADETLEEASRISFKAFCPMSTSRVLLLWSRDAASSRS